MAILVNHEPSEHARIKVIGVGGGGCNAIKRMKEEGPDLPSVEFIAINTDAQVLNISPADIKIQIGKSETKGLGAGAKPDIGKLAAEETLDEIKEYVKDTDLVFLTAGMGGGTGTGASPVIAKLAKDAGCLTISIVTTPFIWEGPVRKRNAVKGIDELSKYSDTIIVISNQKLLSILPKKVKMADSFKEADKILKDATMGISNLIQNPGMISLDFADVVTIMNNAGKAHIGIGYGEGDDRAITAVEQAIHSELLDNVSIKGAKGALVHIIAGNEFELDEMDQIMDRISEEIGIDDADTNVINGLTLDENYDGRIQVLLIVTNLEGENRLELKDRNEPLDTISNKHIEMENDMASDYLNQKDIARSNNIEREEINGKNIYREEKIKEDVVFKNSRDSSEEYNNGLDDLETPPFLQKYKNEDNKNSFFSSQVFDKNLFKNYLD